MAAQSLVSVTVEKTKTPARFEPMPSKKHANRMLHIKNKASVPKYPNASSSRVSAKQKTVRNVDSERWLRKVSSASDSKRPKHQQDSSPCQAKNTQTECFTSPLEPIKNNNKKQSFGSETPERQQQSSLCQAKNRMQRGFRTMAAQSLVSVRFEKTETPARFEPMPSKKHANRMLHVTFGTHKKQSFGSETTERQHESSPCQAKNTPKECLKQVTFGTQKKQCFGPAPQHPNASKIRALKNNALVRFHNTQTPARFEPMLRKKHADRMLHVTFGTYNPLKSAKNIKKTIKNKALVRFRNTRTPWIPNDGCSKSRQRQIRKDQNTSKIRAHAKQKTRGQNASRHLWNP